MTISFQKKSEPNSSFAGTFRSKDTFLVNALQWQDHYNQQASNIPGASTYEWEEPIVLLVNNDKVLRIRGTSSNNMFCSNQYFWISSDGVYDLQIFHLLKDTASLEPTINHIIQSLKIPDKQ